MFANRYSENCNSFETDKWRWRETYIRKENIVTQQWHDNHSHGNHNVNHRQPQPPGQYVTLRFQQPNSTSCQSFSQPFGETQKFLQPQRFSQPFAQPQRFSQPNGVGNQPQRFLEPFGRGIPPQRVSQPAGFTVTPEFTPHQDGGCGYKRKSESINTADDGEINEEDEEELPSIKRQRISLDDVEKLFANFTINEEVKQVDEEREKEDEKQREEECKETFEEFVDCEDRSRREEDKRGRKRYANREVTVDYNFKVKRFKMMERIEERSEEDKEEKSEEDKEEKSEEDKEKSEEENEGEDKDESNSEAKIGERSVEETETKEDSNKDTDDKDTKEESDETGKEVITKKREGEEVNKEGNSNKRLKKIKRGLRLCSNITCYIEQVLYNC